MDYIEIPNKKWYFSKVSDEVYEFDSGLFRDHPHAAGDNEYHKKASTIKPPHLMPK